MTTKVTIEANCSDQIEVEVILTDDGELIDSDILQNGESSEYYVYDKRAVYITEIEK